MAIVIKVFWYIYCGGGMLCGYLCWSHFIALRRAVLYTNTRTAVQV